MATDITDTQLQQLSKRWAKDPTPHLALQLADVYRNRGQTAEAVPILERGLEVHPGHVSIQVALGRYRLEAGDAEGAAAVLHRVVDKDPGHLVANKLLVRAHLALGERKSAADRLDLYALLNDSDPELEALRSSVASELPPATAARVRPPLPEVFGMAEALPESDLASLARPGRRMVTGALDRHPFAELREAPLEPTALGGLFERATTQQLESPPEQPGRDSVRQEAEPEPAERSEETEESPMELPEDDGSSDDAVIEVEAGSEPPADAVLEQESPAAEEPDAEPREPAEVDAGAGATATLGALYLAQGHLADAKHTFEQVLERAPDDAEALAGIDEVARRSEPTESAATASPHSAKIARLEQYLSRIRAAAERLSA